MQKDRLVKISKYLSKHLRHQPERLGLVIHRGGWVSVDALLASCAERNFPVTRDELEEVVALNDKRRFSFDESGGRIRANQGHSIDVDLELEAAVPPPVLFHGTGERSVSMILAEGLRKMGRRHVHLSLDASTAMQVGARHGRPVVHAIRAGEMHGLGHEFFLSWNGVWLTECVPPQFIDLPGE